MVSWLRANGKIIFRGAALLLAGAAAGFGLGLFFAVPAGPGCQESDLTPVPDTGFASPAPEAAPASSLPQEEPMPEKWVCLTFDDGPSKTTPAVLDALNTAGVKATFFVVATGYNEKYLPLIADAAAAGHQIALHSASHEYSDIYQSSAAYWQDIELLKERISPYVNTTALHYLRFPGGSTNTVSRRYGGRGVMAELKQQCAEKGYVYVDWNVCAEDAVGGKPSAGTIYRNVVREISEQYDLQVLRFFMLSAHYRGPLNFSADLMEAAKNGLERILTGMEKLREMEAKVSGDAMTAEEQENQKKAMELVAKYEAAMDDDFNTADAISAIFELIKLSNSTVSGASTKEYVSWMKNEIQRLCDVMGIITEKKKEVLDSEVEDLIAQRQAARKAKNFALADEIRGKLLDMGIVLEDTREGVKWKRA